jgi:hypothetical protein
MMMTLESWLTDKLIEIHRPSAQEITELLVICDRDLEKSQIADLGPDWQMAIAYNAALQASIAALAAAGYRTTGEGRHYRAIQSLAYTIGAEPSIIKQLDRFRQKRNISDYEHAGMVTEEEARAMISLAGKIRNSVREWLKKAHNELINE